MQHQDRIGTLYMHISAVVDWVPRSCVHNVHSGRAKYEYVRCISREKNNNRWQILSENCGKEHLNECKSALLKVNIGASNRKLKMKVTKSEIRIIKLKYLSVSVKWVVLAAFQLPLSYDQWLTNSLETAQNSKNWIDNWQILLLTIYGQWSNWNH